jgi:hypothetical protein
MFLFLLGDMLETQDFVLGLFTMGMMSPVGILGVLYLKK